MLLIFNYIEMERIIVAAKSNLGAPRAKRSCHAVTEE